MRILKYIAVMLVLAYLGFKLIKIPFIGPILQKIYEMLFPPAAGDIVPNPVEPEVILDYGAPSTPGGEPEPLPPSTTGIDPRRLDWATNQVEPLVSSYTAALFASYGLSEDEDAMLAVLAELNEPMRIKLFEYWYELFRQTKRNAPTFFVTFPSFHNSLSFLDGRLSEVPTFVAAYNLLHPTNGLKYV